MSRRRVSCPLTAQQLWDAVKIIRYKRQVPDIERITRYMNRTHNVSDGKRENAVSNFHLLWRCPRFRFPRKRFLLRVILAFVLRFSQFSDEVGRQINYCVRDGLLKVIKKIGSKGSKIGVEQEGYKLPDDKVIFNLPNTLRRVAVPRTRSFFNFHSHVIAYLFGRSRKMVTTGTVSNVTAEATLFVVLLVTEFITFRVCRKTIYPKTT